MEQIDKIPKRPSGFVRAITWFICVALLACAGYIAYNKFIADDSSDPTADQPATLQ